MRRDPRIVVLGEDVGRFGGVFRATVGSAGGVRRRSLHRHAAGRGGDHRRGDRHGALRHAPGARDPVRRLHLSGGTIRSSNELAKFRYRSGGRVPGAGRDPHADRRRHQGRALPLAVARGAVHAHAGAEGGQPVEPRRRQGAAGQRHPRRRPGDLHGAEAHLPRSRRARCPRANTLVPLGEAKVVRARARQVTVIALGRDGPRRRSRRPRRARRAASISRSSTCARWCRSTSRRILTSVKKTGRVVIVHEAPRTCGFGAELAATDPGEGDPAPRGADPARHRLRHAVPVHARARVPARRRPRPGRGRASREILEAGADGCTSSGCRTSAKGSSRARSCAGWSRKATSLREDQPMVEIMTDKATVEIPSPRAGPRREADVRRGADLPGRQGAGRDRARRTKAAAERGRRGGRRRPRRRACGRRASAPHARRGATNGVGARDAACWRRRRRASWRASIGVDLRDVAGTGPDGRVTHGRRARAATAPRTPASAAATATPAPVRVRRASDVRLPFRGVRKKIAENMVRVEADRGALHLRRGDRLTELVGAARARQGSAGAKRGIKLSFLPFIIKATVAALKKFPQLNATLDEAAGEIVLREQLPHRPGGRDRRRADRAGGARRRPEFASSSWRARSNGWRR